MSASQLGHILDAAPMRSLPLEPVRLSPREVEVCRMACCGITNKQIASNMGLSVKTIEKHRQQVNVKLKSHHPIQMVRCAIVSGYITVAEWMESCVVL